MMGHWVILSAAISMGSMASFGLMHFLSVAEVKEASSRDEMEPVLKVQEQDSGVPAEQLSTELNALEERLRAELIVNQEKLSGLVEELIGHVEGLEQKQSSQAQQLKLISRELTAMEFKMETLDRSFIPLPESEETRFRSMESTRASSLLLPER